MSGFVKGNLPAATRPFLLTTQTQIALTPSTGTKLIGNEFSLALRDEFGVLVEAAAWQTSDAGVITVSADDPPVLTAVGAGTSEFTPFRSGTWQLT